MLHYAAHYAAAATSRYAAAFDTNMLRFISCQRNINVIGYIAFYAMSYCLRRLLLMGVDDIIMAALMIIDLRVSPLRAATLLRHATLRYCHTRAPLLITIYAVKIRIGRRPIFTERDELMPPD